MQNNRRIYNSCPFLHLFVLSLWCAKILLLLGKINANDYKSVIPTDCAFTIVVMSHNQTGLLLEILDESSNKIPPQDC